MEHEVLGIPRPKIIIYLKVPLETSLALLAEKRSAKSLELGDGERDQVENDRHYLERSHETAGWLAGRQPNWHIIDCVDAEGGMRSKESIHEEILEVVKTVIS